MIFTCSLKMGDDLFEYSIEGVERCPQPLPGASVLILKQRLRWESYQITVLSRSASSVPIFEYSLHSPIQIFLRPRSSLSQLIVLFQHVSIRVSFDNNYGIWSPSIANNATNLILNLSDAMNAQILVSCLRTDWEIAGCTGPL